MLRSYRAGFRAPGRMAVDAAGNVYVIDPLKNEVVVRAPSGRVIGRRGGFASPVSIAVDGSNRILVGDASSGSVTAYAADWQPLFQLGVGAAEFGLPGEIDVAPATGTVYVADSTAHLVKMYDSSGASLGSFGGQGTGDGQFSYPSAIFVDPVAAEVLVGDEYNFRVQIFDLAGNFLSCFGGTQGKNGGEFNVIRALWADAQGRVYVADSFNGRIQVLDRSGAFISFISDFGAGQGKLQVPLDMIVDPWNRLFVSATNNSRLEVFGLDTYSDPETDAPAAVSFQPVPLDRTNPAAVVTAYIEVAGYDAQAIDPNSVTANGVPANAAPAEVGDHDGDGDPDLRVDFDWTALLATLPTEGEGTVTVTGTIAAMQFEAVQAVQVKVSTCGSAAPPCTLGGADPTCNEAVCVEGVGCTVVVKPDGAPCADADLCTAGDTCSAGVCLSGSPYACDDNSPCTADSCDSALGCVYTPVAGTCDDGNTCTIGDECVDGVCTGAPASCDDLNPCTYDVCDPASGCVFTNVDNPCDDEDACTTGDTCINGGCIGGPPLVCDSCQICDSYAGCVGDACTLPPTSTPEPTDTPTETPTPTVFAGGNILVYSNANPVPGAVVSGSAVAGGPALMTALTDAFGAFSMGGVPPGPWVIEPRLTDTRARILRGLSSLDASWVQRQIVGVMSFTGDQLLAGDTTGNGSLSTLDAVRIQEMRIGLRTRLPAAENCGSDWLFVPDPGPAGDPTPVAPLLGPGSECRMGRIEYASITAGTGGQDFRAVLLGDTTGNWSAPSGGGAAAIEPLAVDDDTEAAGLPAAPAIDPPACEGACVVAMTPTADSAGATDVVLAANHLAGVQAFDLAVTLPPGASVAAVDKAQLSARAGDCRLVWNVRDGELLVSLACLHAIDGGGALLTVSVEGIAGGDASPGVSTCVLNEGEVPCAAR